MSRTGFKIPTPLRPGSVMLSDKGSTFTLERDGLWHNTSGNAYALSTDLPDGWQILWDAADLDDDFIREAVLG